MSFTQPAVSRWKPPTVGFLKLNTDAAVRGESGCGLGGVVRDDMGAVVWGFAQRRDGVLSVDVAEALAVKEGVHLAATRGVSNLVIEVDS